MMETVQLGEIVKLRKGKKAVHVHEHMVNDSRPYIQIDEVRGKIPQRFASDPKGIEVVPADLCIVWDGANAGTVGYGAEGIIGSTVARIRLTSPNGWDARFIGRLLQSKFHQLNDQAHARGATIPHVDKSKLEAITLPRISKNEQRRIATILDKADGIRRKREKALKFANQFLRSVFDRLFCDLQNNPKGWDTALLRDILSVDPQNGLYRPSKDYGSGTYILRIDGFYDGYLIKDRLLKQLSIDRMNIEKYLLHDGDIIINRVNSREYLGKSTLIEGLTEETVFESNMMRLRVEEHITDPRFLVDQLQTQFIKRQILRASKDAVNQSSINQTDVKNLEVRLPPIDLQIKYAEVVAKKNSSDHMLYQALAAANDLFEGLAQRAFRGEL